MREEGRFANALLPREKHKCGPTTRHPTDEMRPAEPFAGAVPPPLSHLRASGDAACAHSCECSGMPRCAFTTTVVVSRRHQSARPRRTTG